MKLETKEEIELLKKETNTEVTERISKELKAERKLEERKQAVMNMYFELTGTPMSNADFEIYNYCFNRAKDGFNIKSWIRDREILIADYNKKKENSLNGDTINKQDQ